MPTSKGAEQDHEIDAKLILIEKYREFADNNGVRHRIPQTDSRRSHR